MNELIGILYFIFMSFLVLSGSLVITTLITINKVRKLINKKGLKFTKEEFDKEWEKYQL